jgi:hypothetical protein
MSASSPLEGVPSVPPAVDLSVPLAEALTAPLAAVVLAHPLSAGYDSFYSSPIQKKESRYRYRVWFRRG